MKLVILGLSLSSSWGNGHATSWRALLKGLAAHGCESLFLERPTPWYAANMDLVDPNYCRLAFYNSLEELDARWRASVAEADLVIVGSYVPDGIAVIDYLREIAGERLCFYDIDTPVTLTALRSDDCAYLRARQIPDFLVYFSFAGGEALRLLEQEYAVRSACALYCCADPDLYAPTREPIEWDLGYLGTYSVDRQPALDRLLLEPARPLPHMRFVVAGPQYPASIDWPANVERIDHLPPGEHASFYSRQRYSLNVTRADMARLGWSPSVRLFEAGCCATAIISDPWRGIEDVFEPGEEIIIARETQQVVDALLNNEMAARIGGRARERELRDHNGFVRSRVILDFARARPSLANAAGSQRSMEGIADER